MSGRKKSHDTRLSLPWEHGQNAIAALVSSRRVVPLLSLIGVLLGGAGAFFMGGRRADMLATRATVHEVERATRTFIRDVGRCPHGPPELVHPPKSGVHYLSGLPEDAWGHALYFRCTDGDQPQIEVVSAGPSGSFLDDDNVM